MHIRVGGYNYIEKKGSGVIHNLLPETGIGNVRNKNLKGLNTRSKYIEQITDKYNVNCTGIVTDSIHMSIIISWINS